MKKIEFGSSWEDTIKGLDQNKDVQRFLKENQLDASFVQKHASDFLLWTETMERCSYCRGLKNCTQPLAGKRKVLKMDEGGYLIQCFESCPYQRQQDQKRDHRKYYRLFDGSPSDLEIDLMRLKPDSAGYQQAYKTILASIKADKGVYLYGQPGVGKTYMMLGLCNYFARQKQSVAFVKVPELISELKQTLTDTDHRNARINALKFSDIVVLDDIGAEAISAWTRDDILLPVLEHRMTHQKKTYFTSNYAPEELQNQYVIRNAANSKVGALRLMERIRALSNACNLLGQSRR